VDAGKSTLLGVLTHGELDNGRGFARQKLFRHKHEMESGRTSSVGNDILGFDQEGHVSRGTGDGDYGCVPSSNCFLSSSCKLVFLPSFLLERRGLLERLAVSDRWLCGTDDACHGVFVESDLHTPTQ